MDFSQKSNTLVLVREEKRKYKKLVRCELCEYAEPCDIPNKIKCKKYNGMISYADKTCRSAKLKVMQHESK